MAEGEGSVGVPEPQCISRSVKSPFFLAPFPPRIPSLLHMTDLKHRDERAVLSLTCVALTMSASGRALTRKRGRLRDREDRRWGQAVLASVSSLSGGVLEEAPSPSHSSPGSQR